MRILCRMVPLWLCASCALIPEAYSSYPHTYLVNNRIKPNPTVRSKPTSLYPQYASVQFLKSDTNLTFNSDAIGVKAKCASLGYLIPVSQCSSPMMPSYLCSSELNEAGAEQYTNYCCNSNLYTVTNPDTCTDNATALPEGCYWGGSIKYRCACDRSRYPYSTLPGEGCGTNGDFNVNNMCRAPNASGEKISYYTSCCPTSYKECDGSKHLVGKGNSCRIESGGTIVNKYEYCECSSSYDTICGYDRLIRTGDEYVCTDDRGRWTRESNCESECSQTKETNIDQYLYGYGWHCLYKKDGATVKTTEGELCAGYDRDTSTSSPTYYDECEKQGYVKSEADCYISELMMRCPNDSSKVWCLDGKYCTGFPAGEEACNNGAKIKKCSSQDNGIRCAYDDDRCNKCWEDGVYKLGCANYDTSTKGDSEVCCKRGYRMADSICVKNVCDRTKFPYEQNPGDLQGQLEFCYEGDEDASLGYKTYFGYGGCNSDEATGGMWKQADDNPRKCVCMRKDDNNSGRTWLPFGTDNFFDSNADITNNYTNVGFGEGKYGITASCTDADGTYYGYSSCFIGYQAGTLSANKGMCLVMDIANTYEEYKVSFSRYSFDAFSKIYTDNIIMSAGENELPELQYTIEADKSYCINRNHHYKDINGNVFGDNTVAALLIPGCDKGNEEECSVCYHTSNLSKNSDGKYTVHNKFKLKVTTQGIGIALNFEKCPSSPTYQKSTSFCYKTCSVNNPKQCSLGDILQDTDGSNIGSVYYNTAISAPTASSHKLYILALSKAQYLTWAEAMSYAASYAPTGKENHAIWGKGKWALPLAGDADNSIINWSTFDIYRDIRSTQDIYFPQFWLQTEQNANTAYYRYNYGNLTASKTTKNYTVPYIKWSY